MKRIYALLLVVLMAVVSCQKDETSVFSTEIIKAQFGAIIAPTDAEVVSVVPVSEPVAVLKSANTMTDQGPTPVLKVNIRELDERTFQIYETQAIKSWKYEEKIGARRIKSGTISKVFPVKNGNIDLTQYELRYVIDCPWDTYFTIKNHNGNIVQIHYFLRFDNGEQDDWYGNSNQIIVSPIAKAKYQLEIMFDNGDMNQIYSSEWFACFGSSEIELKLKIKADNTMSILEIPREITQNQSSIRIFGEYGNYAEYRLLYDEELPDVLSFRLPFEPRGFQLCGEYICWYDVKIVGVTIPDNFKVFGIN